MLNLNLLKLVVNNLTKPDISNLIKPEIVSVFLQLSSALLYSLLMSTFVNNVMTRPLL